MTVYQIPSYDRADRQATVGVLHALGIPKKDIWIGVDDEAQYALYRDAVGDMATVLICNSTNCAEARASMQSRTRDGERIVTLDDDIRAFSQYVDDRHLQPITDRAEFEKTIDSSFRFAQAHNAPVWGGYPVVNPYFMSRTIDLRNVTLATFMGIVNGPDVRFDPEWRVKEDYELCLRVMRAGKNCVRYNFLVAEAVHHTPGGAMRQWSSGQDEVFTARLCREFPDLVAPAKSAAGFRLLHPVRWSINGPKRGRCRCPTALWGTGRPVGLARLPTARCP